MAEASLHPARTRRTWPQRLLIGFNLVLIIACLVGAGGIAYLYQRFGELPRIEFEADVLAPVPDEPGEPQNYLLVGSDDRANLEDTEAFGTAEEVGEAKSDTIMLVRIDPRAETAAMLSFPRDLYVPIAETGRSDRINTAFNEGGAAGAQRLIETIKENFNIPVHHYAQVDFDGFRRVVDAVGGVDVFLEYPVRDRDPSTGRNLSGLDLPTAGCQELNGDQALSYVRARAGFQQLIDGEWETDPTADLGRIDRQQDFVRRALRKALSEDLLNPLRLNRLIDVADDTVMIDDALGVDDIVELGERFQESTPEALQQIPLLVESFEENEASYVRLVPEAEAQNEASLDVFRGQRIDPNQPYENPSGVSVQVLNGTGTPGESASATGGLEAAGFEVGAPQNATGEGGISQTRVLYASGQEQKAVLLARYLVGPVILEESPDQSTVDVALITGTDYDGIREEPKPLAEVEEPTTTTTDADATTTTADPRSDEEALADFYEAVGRNACQ